jgi:hypothetical protein
MPKQKVDDPIARLGRALAGLPQHRSDLRPAAEPWLLGQANDGGVAPPLIEDDAARVDAAVRAVRSHAQAPVSTTRWPS